MEKHENTKKSKESDASSGRIPEKDNSYSLALTECQNQKKKKKKTKKTKNEKNSEKHEKERIMMLYSTHKLVHREPLRTKIKKKTKTKK